MMDPQDIRSLQILEEIHNNHSPTQRDLAKKLNISLGLANSFIKRLAKKGYVKITTIPRNRVKYILTPKGFAEKSRLTYEFIQYSFHFYKEALGNIQDLLNEFEERGVKKVIFYGANDLAEIAFISLKSTGIMLIGVVDDVKIGGKFLNYTIRSIGELSTLEFDIVIITNIESKKVIFNKLLQKKIPIEKIIMLE
jgi:DNA-binding MarR family transcriptional regulator